MKSMRAIRTIRLSIADKPMNIVVKAVQADSGRSIVFIITDNIDLSGAVARFYAVKPSKLEILTDAAIEGREVIVELTPQTLAEIGVTKCQLSLTQGDSFISSFEFYLSVEKNLSEAGDIVSSNEFTALQNALRTSGWIDSTTVEYQEGNSGTEAPEGEWLPAPPVVRQGTFLWTRITLEHKDGSETVAYSIAWNAVDARITNIANNLVTTDGGYALDARQGRILAEEIATVNVNLSNRIVGLETRTNTTVWQATFRGLNIIARRMTGTFLLRIEGTVTQDIPLIPPAVIATLPVEYRRGFIVDYFTFYDASRMIRVQIRANGDVELQDLRTMSTNVQIGTLSVSMTPRITVVF